MANDKGTWTFKQLAAHVLEQAGAPLTADAIWQEAVALGLDKRLRSVGKTPPATLYSDLHRDTQTGGSDFIRVGSRPRRYWLKARGTPLDQLDVTAPTPKKAANLVERDLHPLLAWFADTQMSGVLVQTIFHEKSKKKSFGEWVHPDLVGVLFPRRALDTDCALGLSAALAAPLCRIYSFELKLRVDFGNLREAFFQAVSNSSWANEGYLVAAEFDDSPEFLDELERLCAAFRIGIIELSPQDPLSADTLIPATARPELDWATIDKLAEMNPDFARFIKNVSDDLKTDIHPKEYDSVPEDVVQYVQGITSKIKG